MSNDLNHDGEEEASDWPEKGEHVGVERHVELVGRVGDLDILSSPGLGLVAPALELVDEGGGALSDVGLYVGVGDKRDLDAENIARYVAERRRGSIGGGRLPATWSPYSDVALLWRGRSAAEKGQRATGGGTRDKKLAEM